MFRKIKCNEFEDVFEIMEKSFPEDERRPYNEQKELLKNSRYEIYVAEEKGIKGFAAVWNFDNFLFIEHLAVKNEERRKGVGSKILEDVKKAFKKRICLEVEPPEDKISRKRIAFYERNGFFLNKFDYIQPSISKGKNPVPLLIMTTNGVMSDEEYKTIKEILYREVYKEFL